MRVAIVKPWPRPGWPTPRAFGAALPAPIEAPHRQPAGREIGHRLKIFLDALGKTADHDAFGAGICRRQMAPAELCSIRGGKTAPNETRRFEKPGWQRRQIVSIIVTLR